METEHELLLRTASSPRSKLPDETTLSELERRASDYGKSHRVKPSNRGLRKAYQTLIRTLSEQFASYRGAGEGKKTP
jgi:hypothetical protein